MSTTYLSEALWANGDVEKVEPTWRSYGWIYRPPSAMTPGGKKTFGRGYEGEEAAKAWHVRQMTKALRRQGWKLPSVLAHVPRHPGDYSGMTVAYQHPHIGWVTFALGVSDRYQKTVEYTVGCHPIVRDLANRRIANPYAQSFHMSLQYDQLSKEETEQRILDWKKNPAETLVKMLDQHSEFGTVEIDRVMRMLKVPDLTDLPFKANERIEMERDGSPVTTHAKQDVIFRLQKEVETFFVDDETRNVLDTLSAALKFYDVDFRIQTGYRDGRYNALNGIYIKVPELADVEGREESHEIHIRLTGTTVRCGFMRDAENALEYQKRQALEYFQNIEEFVEMTFDEEGDE